MKQLFRHSLGTAIVTIFLLLLNGCSKPKDDIKPVPHPDPGGGGETKYPVQVTQEPKLNEDTLMVNQTGQISFNAIHLTNTKASIGTVSSDKKAVYIDKESPAGTCQITLFGEKNDSLTRNVPVPRYDPNFSFITFDAVNGTLDTKKWQEDGDTTFSTAFPLGYQVSSPDLNKYIFKKTIVNGKRSGTAIAPNGSTSTGWWNSLNGGAQFQNGGGVYDNVFVSETRWILERSYSSGGFSYIRRIHYKVVP